MNPLVECVPNFSEGRDPAVIQAITDAIAAVEGVSLLDVDPGRATNRTVVTLVGAPEAVLEGAFAGIARASELIDMTTHKGEHPRIGATDVCPFVPVRDITVEECVALAHALGERVGRELGIPVYHYEHAATRPERQNLAVVREGEYEGLQAKLADPEGVPDHGPSEFSERVARTGATVIGVRPFLIAFNVNLNTRNTNRAMKIAATVREKGIYRRNEDGSMFLDPDGQKVRDPGMFKCVKAIGWFLDEYDRCQISINFTDYRVSPPHEVVDAIRRVAEQEGVVMSWFETGFSHPGQVAKGIYEDVQGQNLVPPAGDDAVGAFEFLLFRSDGILSHVNPGELLEAQDDPHALVDRADRCDVAAVFAERVAGPVDDLDVSLAGDFSTSQGSVPVLVQEPSRYDRNSVVFAGDDVVTRCCGTCVPVDLVEDSSRAFETFVLHEHDADIVVGGAFDNLGRKVGVSDEFTESH